MLGSNEYGIHDMLGHSHIAIECFFGTRPSREKICRYRKNEKLVLECEVADHQINGEMPAQVSRHVAPSAVSIRHQYLATATFFRAMPAFWMAWALLAYVARISTPTVKQKVHQPKLLPAKEDTHLGQIDRVDNDRGKGGGGAAADEGLGGLCYSHGSWSKNGGT